MSTLVPEIEPPVSVTLFDARSVNVPAAAVVPPITVPSIVPPLISAEVTTVEVNVPTFAVTLPSFSRTPSTVTPAPTVSSLIVSAFMFGDVTPATLMPAAALIGELNVISPPPVVASTVSAFRPVVVTVVNVPAAEAFAPIVVPSIAPPLISTFPDVRFENVPAADVVPPITTLSIAEPAAPSTSSTPSTSSVLPEPTVIS